MASKENFSLLDSRHSSDCLTTSIHIEWEYVFATQICAHYSCKIWLPSLVLVLQKIEMGSWNKELFMELLVAVHFISDKLEDPEISFKLKCVDNPDDIQVHTWLIILSLCFFIVSVLVGECLLHKLSRCRITVIYYVNSSLVPATLIKYSNLFIK